MQHTFLWHDYETFGANTRLARPAQFAAIRTDAELNEIGEPLMLYCQPAPDFLPEPEACLITGITPQLCLERGIPEYQFAQQINAAFSQAGTIGVGYNTIRFDDEITRFMFWRNLIEPYAREWQNNCGRWDILDMLRTTYALRPDGINWPLNDEGKVSFKLEHLCAANGITHEAAHDALSDVRATIALAKLVKQKQPKLFDFCFNLHKKTHVAQEIGMPEQHPFLHISGMFSVDYGCLSLVYPLATHPTNKNEVIVWDCRFSPQELLGMNAEAIRARMFVKTADLPEGVSRLPIKTIHLNKSPIVIRNLKTLSEQQAQKWQIDVSQALEHVKIAQNLPDMNAIWAEVFDRSDDNVPVADVDADLYNGFIGTADRRLLQTLVAYRADQAGEKIARAQLEFQDARLDELVFRYRARNFPKTLTEPEQLRWQDLCASRFFDGAANALTVNDYFAKIDLLAESVDEQGQEVLAALYDYAEMIVPVRD